MQILKTRLLFLIVPALAAIVFLSAHWNALTNHYVINDDVRQQIFWMQQWERPELYRNDLLTEYSRNYVPWGVQFIYYLMSPFINPIDFSKVLTGALFIIGALLIFALSREILDEVLGLLVVSIYLVSLTFLYQMSGGLARAFGYPLILGYLYLIQTGRILAASVVIVIAALFNPYITLLCLVTHILFILGSQRAKIYSVALSMINDWRGGRKELLGFVKRNLALNWPIAIAVALMAAKYIIFGNDSFGPLVGMDEMLGKVEYTEAGRYPILPVPSYIQEVFRPFETILPFWELGYFPYGFIVCLFLGLWGVLTLYLGRTRFPEKPAFGDLWVLFYLFIGSSILYWAAKWTLMSLFLPRRYMEYSMAVIWIILMGIGLSITCEYLINRRFAAMAILLVSVVVGAMRLEGVGLHDYSSTRSLCKYIRSTPSTSLIAGPLDLMDCSLTFGKRRAFVTYELAHTWYRDYWSRIKERGVDFIHAYYAKDPSVIRKFAEKHHVDYLVVREADFSKEIHGKGNIWFEPFNTLVGKLKNERGSFAALNTEAFPVVYRTPGIRVLKLKGYGPKVSELDGP